MTHVCALLRGPLLLGCALAGCAAPPLDLAPGERPPEHTVEAGLWLEMERVEANLKSSGRIVQDEQLNAYVRAIVCALSPEYCDQIRIYIVQTPHFNASMRPNGAMEVWTGLILRAENEAQLAFVLAHEIAHFQRRHSLQRWQDVNRKAGGLVFLKIATAAAGVGYAGDLVELAAVGSILAFSRENEADADAIGLERMVEAGYDAREAPKVWKAVLAERDAADDDPRLSAPVFLSTHPSPASRMETLSELSAARPGGGTGADRFRAVTRALRVELLRDELRSRRFKRTQWLLAQLLERGVGRSEIEFFHGELYRTRGEEGDAELALEWYESAAAHPDAAPAVLRALGMQRRRLGDAAGARDALRRYLERAPDAEDRAMIESYLADLEEAQ